MKIVNPYKFVSRLLIFMLLLGSLYVYLPREEPLVELTQTLPTAKITILSGDTLWTLAEKLYPDNPREGVFTLKQLNELRDDVIYPGQILLVPSDASHQSAQE